MFSKMAAGNQGVYQDMRPHMIFAAVASAAMALAGCSGGGAGISTASVLDGAPSGATGAGVGIANTDPNARPVQVAWTAARAQRCGFLFDPVKLKTNFLASEARGGALQPQLASTEKAYDQTYTSISTRIKGEPDFCNDKKNAAIKVDLQRHLAGDFTPNLPAEKKVASGGFFDGLIIDQAPQEKLDAKSFWEDQAAKKSGAKGAQQ
jgi:hypothetical protein